MLKIFAKQIIFVWFVLWFLGLIFFSISKNFAQKIPQKLYPKPSLDVYSPKKFTQTALLQDLETLQNVVEFAHPSVDWYVPRTIWYAGIDSLKKKLDKETEMTERDFFVQISRLLANIHCGHTVALPSDEYVKHGKRLPLDLVFLEDKAHILKSHYNKIDIPLGAEILRINGEPFTQIIEKILPALPQDAFHTQHKYQQLQEDFANYYDLFVAQPDTFYLDLLTRQNQKVSCKIPAIDSVFLREFDKDYINNIIERPTLELTFIHLDSTNKTPQSLQNIPTHLHKDFVKNSIAVLSIRSFLPQEMRIFKQKFEKFIRKSFAFLTKNPPKALAIDMRENDGGVLWYVSYLFGFLYQKPYQFVQKVVVTGNGRFPEIQKNVYIKNKLHKPFTFEQVSENEYTKTEYILKEKYLQSFRNEKLLKAQKQYYYSGKLYVLTSNKTFSAGSHFANLIKQTKRGILVGEETGGGAKGCTAGYFLSFKLPNTLIDVQVPAERWQNDNANVPQENGVLPDYRIPRHIDAILQKQDKTMSFIIWKTMEN